MKKEIRVFILAAIYILVSATMLLAAETSPVILFDQGHGQRFLIQEKGELHLSSLADMVLAADGKVVASSSALTPVTLSKVAAVVISGPFAPYSADEIEALLRFMDAGGRVVCMLHIGQPLADLLHRLDIDISNAVLHERHNIIEKDINFQVKELSQSALLQGVPSFSLYGGWALNPGEKVQSLARTSSEAWVDLDGDKQFSEGDASMAFSVVVAGKQGKGSFMVFGDDAIFQNRYLDANNQALARNLVTWLLGK